MTTYFGKSCSFCLPRVPFVNCRQFMYLVISLLVLRAGYGIWLYQFLIIAYLFTSHWVLIEKYLNVFITKDGFTSHVCKTCIRIFVAVENKVAALKEKFDATVQKLKSTHGKQSQKRLITNPDSTSKMSLFQPRENNENIRPSMFCIQVNIFS